MALNLTELLQSEPLTQTPPMHWKLKAAIQNAVSLLPASVSYASYYWIQRHLGRLRSFDPISRLNSGIKTWQRLENLGVKPTEKTFFEVGTGRVPLAPLAYWLMGADKTITIDLNPYMKAELLAQSLQFISSNRDAVCKLFGPLLREDRLRDLLLVAQSSSFNASAFLDQCRIQYIAPGDAADTGLPAESIDFHTSYTVFEHIPPHTLAKIIAEGTRIMRPGGVFIHRIDYSDHFSHTDNTISSINFLQYSDTDWERYAGNRYMYMNRLRHDDYLNLFQSAQHHLLDAATESDDRAMELLRNGLLKIDERFKAKSQEVLSIRGAWIASRK